MRAAPFLLMTMALAVPDCSEDDPGVLGVALARHADGTVFVARVAENGPAQRAGIKPGDVVLRIDEKPVTDAWNGRYLLGSLKPGAKVTLRIRRGGEEKVLPVTAGKHSELTKSYGAAKLKVGDPAPEWFAESWDLPEGMTEPPTRQSTQGKVVVIHAFQTSCPNCKSRGLPVHRQLEEDYELRDDIAIFHIQTVFEGFDHNTPASAVKAARDLGITAPVLEDARFDRSRLTEFMRTFGTGGTPWSVVIDKKGRIAFTGYTPDHATLRAVVDKAAGPPPPPGEPARPGEERADTSR